MELATVARPYSEACYAALPGDLRPAFADTLDALAAAAANEQMRSFAQNPRASSDQVSALLTVGVKAALTDEAKRLIALLIENSRIDALPDIARQFRTKLDASLGMAEALIESAFALDDATLAALVAQLEKKFGQRLRASVVIDPSLIGGVRVKVGDEVLDASVKASLTHMKNSLTA